MSRKTVCFLVVAGLAAITAAVFYPAGGVQFVFDDYRVIVNNKHLQEGLSLQTVDWAFTEFYASNWYPLTWLSHAAAVQFFGLDPFGHHLINAVIHTLNSCLLFLVLMKMTGALWRSAFVAAMFAVHPLHVETVAFVTERCGLLSTFFGFLAIAAYYSYCRRPGFLRYGLVMLAMIASLMSKPMLVTLPLILLLLDYWPLRRWHAGREERGPSAGKFSMRNTLTGSRARLIYEKIPLLSLSVLFSAVAYLPQKQGGAIATFRAFPLGMRLAHSLVSYTAYLWKTIWPLNLTVYYPLPLNPWPLWVAGLAFLFLAGTSTLVLVSTRRFPYLVVGWFWYLVTLLPVIGLIKTGEHAMADRYTYVPLVGLFIVAAWGMDELTGKIGLLRKPALAAAAAVLAGSVLLTNGQLKLWNSNRTLFRHAFEITEGNYLAHFNYGWALEREGERAEALRHISKAAQILPQYQAAHYSLGVLLAQEGRLGAAETHYRTVLQLNSEHSEAHTNLANLLGEKGRLEEAIRHLRLAIKLNAADELAHFNLGMMLERSGDMESAIGQYREVLRLQPDYEPARKRLYELTRRMRESGR